MTVKELPTSVQWPEHWRNVPLWAMFDRVKDVGHPDEEMLSVYRTHGVIQKSSRDDNTNQTAENRDIYQLVNHGWFIVNRMKAWQGSVGISPLRGIVSGHYLCFRPNHQEDARFLNWLLRSTVYATEYARMSRGVRPGQIEIDNDELRGLRVALPPLDEQCRIADFLDTETARIDDLVLLRTSQVATLSDALHSEASRLTGRHQVCRDRLPSLRRMPLRRVVEDVQTGLTPTELLQPIGNPGVVPWYTPAALKGMLELGAPEKGIQQEVARSVPRFQAGSILLVGIGESLGKVADLDHEATGNQQLTAITTYDSIDRRFLAWQLAAAHEEIRAWAQYSRIRILNNDNLKAFPVLVPSLADQLAARKELDDRLAQLREFGSAAARFSSRAAERRQALITAAVTGQIDVTTARGVAT